MRVVVLGLLLHLELDVHITFVQPQAVPGELEEVVGQLPGPRALALPRPARAEPAENLYPLVRWPPVRRVPLVASP